MQKPLKSKKPRCDSAPHQAIILVSAEVMERLPNGMVTGVPKKHVNKLFTVLGKNLQECEQNLNLFMEKIYGKSNKDNESVTVSSDGHGSGDSAVKNDEEKGGEGKDADIHDPG